MLLLAISDWVSFFLNNFDKNVTRGFLEKFLLSTCVW